MKLTNTIRWIIIIVIPSLILWLVNPIFQSIDDEKRNEVLLFEVIYDSSPSIASVDISIVIPCYNEELRLTAMLDSAILFMDKWTRIHDNSTYEIIIVDDGSKDQTSVVGSQYQPKVQHLKVLKLVKNQGKGGALKTGVLASKGNHLLMADADGATDIADFEKLYESIKTIEIMDRNLNGMVAMTVGSRAHLEAKSIATRALYRTILMRGFHFLVTLLCTKTIHDTQCGFKLFTAVTAKKLFNNLHLYRWAFDIELIYMAEKLNIPMSEVAVNWQEIPGSKLIQNKLDVITTSLTMARDILAVKIAYSLGLWKIK